VAQSFEKEQQGMIRSVRSVRIHEFGGPEVEAHRFMESGNQVEKIVVTV
jgi:hypothetical protein